MRKLVLYTLTTLDGAVDEPGRYFGSGPDGVPVFDDAMVEFEREVIERQDAVLLGRGMHDEWSRFWPTSTEEPFAGFVNGVRKHVVTSRPLESDWGEVTALRGPIGATVRDLKRTEGGDVGVHGSITLAQGLLAEGLVDELRLVVAPAVGFGGRRLFTDGLGVRRFELVEHRSSPSGSLLLTYRPQRP